TSGGTYGGQFNGLYGCAVGGVRAVLTAAGETLMSAGISAIDPSQNESACFGIRATNEAMAAGYAIDFNNGMQRSVKLEVLAGGISFFSASNAIINVLAPGVTFDLLKVGALTRLRALRNPMGTEVA